MNILITSGGTKVPIDPVRDLTNMSSGTFGSKIAAEFLAYKHHVHYMISKGGKTPFSTTVDFYRHNDMQTTLASVGRLYDFALRHADYYHEYPYRDFEEYAAALEENVKYLKPEIVILAAAVSDYLVSYSDHKVKSAKELTLHLQPAPKLISRVKLWRPETTLVGFKLLIEASDDELVEAAQGSIGTNGCDMVVANNLCSLKEGRHRIVVVRRNREKNAKQPFLNYEYGEGCDLAREVVENAFAERKMKCAETSSSE